VAKNHGAFLDLETRLQGHTAFARVFPLTERKLNPSRPEIDFAMHFDYLPQRASKKDLVAKEAAAPSAPAATAAAEPPASPPGAAAPGPAATPGSTATASGPAPAGSEPQAPRVPVAVPAAEAARPASPPFDLKSILGTVGRDGQPRTTETLARLLVAPGGVYLPSEGMKGDGGNPRSSRHAAGVK